MWCRAVHTIVAIAWCSAMAIRGADAQLVELQPGARVRVQASGVVAGRREGRNVFYRLSDAHVRLLLDVTREHALHDGRSR